MIMKCKKCGAEIDEVAFCPYCGSVQNEQKRVSSEDNAEVSNTAKSVYYNPYSVKNSSTKSESEVVVGENGVPKFRKRRHVGATLTWIFIGIGLFLFVLGIIITKASMASFDKLNAGQIIFLILGGWVFFIFSGIGGIFICGILMFGGVIAMLIEVIVYKGKSVYSWITFAIAIIIFVAFIVLVVGTDLMSTIFSTK